MKIHIVVVAYGLPEDTEKLLACKPAVKKNYNKFHWHLFLHSQITEVVAVCEKAAKRKNVTYYPYGTNRGLAKSWNEGILAGYDAGADVVIVSNDDMMPGPGDIETVAEAAMKQREEGQLIYLVDAQMYDKRQDAHIPSTCGFLFSATEPAFEII